MAGTLKASGINVEEISPSDVLSGRADGMGMSCSLEPVAGMTGRCRRADEGVAGPPGGGTWRRLRGCVAVYIQGQECSGSEPCCRLVPLSMIGQSHVPFN